MIHNDYTLRPTNLVHHRYKQSDFERDTVQWQTQAMCYGSVLIATVIAVLAVFG